MKNMYIIIFLLVACCSVQIKSYNRQYSIPLLASDSKNIIPANWSSESPGIYNPTTENFDPA